MPLIDDAPTPRSTQIGCVVMVLLVLALIALFVVIMLGRFPVNR